MSSSIFFSDFLFKNSKVLYKSISFDKIGDAWILSREYGLFQIVHYIFVAVYFLANIGIVIYSLRKRKQVSKKVLILLSLPSLITMLGYLLGSPLVKLGYEITPITYVLAQIVFLMIVQRMAHYNVSEMVIESLINAGEVGFITIDSKGRYLGSNDTAKVIIPELNNLAIDSYIQKDKALETTITDWVKEYKNDSNNHSFIYTLNDEDEDERIFKVKVTDLYYGKKKCGYQVFLEDDTANQKYFYLISNYNEQLQKDVETKTKNIVDMHNQFILGLATMVESRDNSTGGHIRRTSQGVGFLMEEICKDGSLHLSHKFCENVVKAAPMHDLGKITIDDAILRKPGRFNKEEYEIMKTHAKEGARIIHDILKDTDDKEFAQIAENIAHYHHERVDGSGYPDGKKGDEIPLEARIMAIADVYDALVSERVYKKSYSFELSNKIILNGMGTEFDKKLQKYYEAARPKLEAFYAKERT